MKRIVKRISAVIIIGILLLSMCTGCAMERRSPFFSMIETEYEDEDAEVVLESFCEYVQNTDFTEFDYAYHQEAHRYQPEYVTEIDAYRNAKNTVFCADTKEADYYYDKEEGVLHCDMKAEGAASDLEGMQMEWSDFPYDATMEKAYSMLSYLCKSGDYLQLDYEKKALSNWEYQNRLSMSYWEDHNGEREEWDCRTPEWEERFGECGPYSIAVFCDDDGTRFNCISMTWYEGDMRYTVTWNSYEEILQSDRCVIRYEYDHGLRADNVPSLDAQREQLKEEMGDCSLYEY